MNRRTIWGAASLVLFAIGYFTSGNPSGKFIPVLFAALFAIALFQTIWNFDSFGSATGRFNKAVTPLGQRIVAILSLVIPFVIAMGWFSGRSHDAEIADLKQKGVVTSAEITDGWSTKRRRSGTSYTVKLKFKDQNGAEHEVEESISSSEFEKAGVGMTVDIIYDPADIDLLDVLFDDETRARYGK